MAPLYESNPRDDLPAIPDFSQLSERVWRVMGLNPGKFTLQGTNTYLLGTRNRKFLIDCGDGQPGYVPLLIDSLKKIHPDAYISDILVSHCHKDHWGGLADIMESELNQHQDIKVHKFPLTVERTPYKHLPSFPHYLGVNDLHHGQEFEVDGDIHIRVVHTPGHAEDHCAFHYLEENIVFTADCILGHGSVAFEDLGEYMKGLHRIQDLEPAKLYPGHGEVVENGVEKVAQYISMRMAKENQILSVMKRDLNRGWTPIELVDEMSSASKAYHETLVAVVVRTVTLHLIKLKADGKVELEDFDNFIKFHKTDPYNPNSVFSVVNEKWRLIPDHKESKL